MEKSGLELLCIGNPLIDAFAETDEGSLLRWGLSKPVQHIPIEKLKTIAGEIEANAGLQAVSICSGGGAANAAKIAALLGIKTGFLGSAGSDEYAAVFEKEMADAGALTRLIKKPSPTGMCLFLQVNSGKGNRLVIAASPSAAGEMGEHDLDENLIRSAKVVVLDGYMLGREALVRRIFALADKHGTVVALDLSAANLASERAHEIVTFARVYPLILFMNEDEAKAFYRALRQSRNEKAEDEEEEGLNPDHIALFKTFTANGIFPILAVKLGSKGALVFAGGGMFKEGTIPVKAVNPTGAGDAFCAAFLGAWIRDKSLSSCASLGNKAAREVLNARGTKTDQKALKKLGKQLRK